MHVNFKEKNCHLIDNKKKEFEANLLLILEKFKVQDELWNVKLDVEFISHSQTYNIFCFASHSKHFTLNAKFSDKNLDFSLKKILDKLSTQLKKKIELSKGL